MKQQAVGNSRNFTKMGKFSVKALLKRKSERSEAIDRID
jgi:hypothetical protein